VIFRLVAKMRSPFVRGSAYVVPGMSSSNRRKMLVIHPSPAARRLLWHPYSLDTAYLDTPDIHESFEKPGIHLFWIVSGRGILEARGRQYGLEPGKRVWFLDMMHSRKYSPAHCQTLVKRGIRFGGPGLESWHELLGGGKNAEFTLKEPALAHRAFREIWQLARRKPSGWEWRVHLILTRVLGLLLSARNLLESADAEPSPAVERVLNAIASNPFYDWRVKDLARIAGVSYSGLRVLFLQSQGQSLHDFIQRTRLDQARLLLSNPRFSVKQIAEQLHFSSQHYFSRFFKKWGHISPREFRNQVTIPK
jgi:AraC-like DNA-binding protein